MDDSPEPPVCSRNQTLARVLTEAVNSSGRPRRDIARACGLHKNSFLRTLRGTRDVTAGEAIRILDASGAPPRATLVLALAGSEELALSWMHSQAGRFLEELLARLPSALASELGDNLTEVKPRWATGTAKLVARLLADHVAEAARRDAAIGEAQRYN
jgi:hypothetical protein